MLIGSGIRDAVDVFPIMSRCVRTDDCVMDGHSCSPSCVDEHMDCGCDCVSEFQTEVLHGERCAETLTTVDLMHVEVKLCQRGERLHTRIAVQTVSWCCRYRFYMYPVKVGQLLCKNHCFF